MYDLPDANLSGCVKDTENVKDLCTKYGYTNINVLTDEQATQQNIISALTTMIDQSEEGEHILYYHSGHGTQVPDLDGDEADGLDECIVTYDHDWNDPFTDDKLKVCLQNLHVGAYLYLVFDTCHSGSMSDMSADVEAYDAATSIASSLADPLSRGYPNGALLEPKSIPMPEEMKALVEGRNLSLNKFGTKDKTIDEDGRSTDSQRHTLLSGCPSGEVAYGTQDGGVMTGRFVDLSLKFRRNWPWYRVHLCVRRRIKDNWGDIQTPELHPSNIPSSSPAARHRRIRVLGGGAPHNGSSKKYRMGDGRCPRHDLRWPCEN